MTLLLKTLLMQVTHLGHPKQSYKQDAMCLPDYKDDRYIRPSKTLFPTLPNITSEKCDFTLRQLANVITELKIYIT